VSTDVAKLIIRGLSGQHLYGFLPGNDNRGAISGSVRSKHGWSGPGMGWGQVTPDGIGEWPYLAGTSARARPRDATLFVTWAEVLAVAGRGCADGYREWYEAAYAAWGAAVSEARKDCKPGQSGGIPWVDQDAINETKAALIRHGCEEPEQVLVQGALFEMDAIPSLVAAKGAA
jgi:hypothetical protein